MCKLTIYRVTESDPFTSRFETNWYFRDESNAENFYNTLVELQGGRSSYDDDKGGMDYSLDEKEVSESVYREIPFED